MGDSLIQAVSWRVSLALVSHPSKMLHNDSDISWGEITPHRILIKWSHTDMYILYKKCDVGSFTPRRATMDSKKYHPDRALEKIAPL